MYNSQSKMNFKVDPDTVALNLIGGEVRALMATRNDPSKRRGYMEIGLLNPTVEEFMRKYPQVFGSKQFIHADGSNFFEEIMPLVSTEKENSPSKIKTRMKYGCNLTETQLSEMDGFLGDLYELKNNPEIKRVISDTVSYKNSMEKAWSSYEKPIMEHIYHVLGYTPENQGSVDTYVVYPNFNTHRSYQSSDNNTAMFFGKFGEKDIRKILAHLAHQRVHQPLLPYKKSMTKDEKEEFHAFIKFLTDKDIYQMLSGKSQLEIVTPKENPEVMGKVYPFWLGYKYRNAAKDGLDPVKEIKATIEKDKAYVESLPAKSKRRALYANYDFDKLSPENIARYFKERRGITPYQFAELDFDDKSIVYKSQYLKNQKAEER